jgi:Flp pilus assembly protein TadD
MTEMNSDGADELEAAKALLFAGEEAEAEKGLRRILEKAPGDWIATYWLAVALSDLRRLEEAKSTFTWVLEQREFQPALTQFGEVLIWLGDLPAAEIALRRAIELDPKDDEAHLLLGRAARLAGEFDRALDYLNVAVAIDPTLRNLQNERAMVLFAKERYEESESVVRLAIEQYPNDPWNYALLGRLLTMRRDLLGARSAYERARAIAPRIGLFAADLADIVNRLGFPQEADRLYREGLSCDTSNSVLNRKYGQFLVLTGYGDRGKSYLERAIQQDPTDERAKQELERLN